MVTVRFPNGQAVQYKGAHFIARSARGYTDLRNKKGGRLIAIAPNICIIDFERPSRVYNALASDTDEIQRLTEQRDCFMRDRNYFKRGFSKLQERLKREKQ